MINYSLQIMLISVVVIIGFAAVCLHLQSILFELRKININLQSDEEE